MDSEQKDKVLYAMNEIKEISLDSVLLHMYPSKNLDNEMIASFTPREMIQLLSRAIYQLSDAMESMWRFLPFQVKDSESTLSENILKVANQLKKGNSFNTWSNLLIWIIQYEMQYGIWEQQQSKINRDIKSLVNKSEILTKESEEILEKSKSIIKDIRDHQDVLKILHNHYDSEKQNLGRIQADIDITLQGLRQAELEAASSSGKAKFLSEQLVLNAEIAQKATDQERVRFSQLEQALSETQDNSNDLIKNLSQINDEFTKTLRGAEEKEKHILDQQDEIAKLRGFAADIALGSVFGERQKELQETVKLWRTLSFSTIAIAIAWIIFIFWEYRSQTGIDINWLMLLANVVRTSPAFLLVYFCLDRYTKERNIQEEYAFKAAVSMTITAYAEMIKDEPERVKMLVSTVQGVYTPPILGKPFKPVSINSKHLADSGKSVADAMKSVKEMIGDVTRAAKSSDK